MKMTPFVSSLIILCIACSKVFSQMPEERGIIMSVYAYPDDDKLKHLEKFPGYENVSEVLAKGVSFIDSALLFDSIDNDFVAKRVYAYEEEYRAILFLGGYSKALEVDKLVFDAVHYGVSLDSIQLALDWLSKTIYWCDATYKWIVAASVHEDKVVNDYFRVIIPDHLYDPAGIAVDPIEGYLFWSDAGKEAKIERSDLAGGNRETIVSVGITSPGHMTVDIVDKRIYWIHNEALHSANYDGTETSHITRIALSTPHDLAIFRDVVYVSDIYSDQLFAINKTTGSEVADPMSFGSYTLYGLTVYSEENQPMKDKDYCADLNCDHMCISTKTGAKCICSDGYTMNQTTGKCEETKVGLHKALVYASSTHICYVDIRSLAAFYFDPVCIFTILKDGTNTFSAPAGDMIKMFDLNMKETIAYYVNMDNKIYARQLLLPIGNEGKELIKEAGGTISGIAYDADDSGNLYWCESDTGNIYMTNVNSKDITKVGGTMVKPNNIKVLHSQRKLAWVSGEQFAMGIQTMNMDGTELFDVVSNFFDITALTVDQDQQVFYFLVPSRRSIYSIPVGGSATPQSYYVSLDDSANLILHYNKYVAWVYSSDAYPNAIGSYNYEKKDLIGEGFFDAETVINDIKVLDEKLQSPDRKSPCIDQNGGCEQACVSKYTDGTMTKVCECQLGYKLENDKKSCKTEVVQDNFLLVADWTMDVVLQIDLQTNEINAIPIEGLGSVMGVLYDVENRTIIWSEFYDSQVYSMNLDGTGRKIISDIGYSYAYRFAKDTITGNIYYTAFSSAHIGVITPSGENIWLIDDFLWEDVHAIAVYPEKGWLYYTAIDSESYIARANMDGSNIEKIITGDHVQYPDGLAIDYQNDFLYWCDSSLDTIQRCNLNGEGCETIVNNSMPDEIIQDIVLDDKYLYYSAIRKSHVVQLSLTAPYTKTEVGSNIGLGKIDTISLYKSNNPNRQKVGGGCAANGGLGDCSTICLPTSMGRKCACNAGIDLKKDDKTCSDIYQCSEMITQSLNTTSGSIEINLPKTCSRLNESTCEYTCPKYYWSTIRGDTTLTCTQDGWDREGISLCEEIRCAQTIENGELDSKCQGIVGNTCEYNCKAGFQKTEQKTFCTRNGSWHKNTTDFCEVTTVKEEMKKEDNWDKNDVLIVIIVCAVVIFALFAVVAVLIHKLVRGKRNSSGGGGTVSYKKEPKYARDDDYDDRRRDSEISSGYIQPRLDDIKEEAPSVGMVNPLYNDEPLPAVSHLELPKQRTVSYMDWLKRQ